MQPKGGMGLGSPGIWAICAVYIWTASGPWGCTAQDGAAQTGNLTARAWLTWDPGYEDPGGVHGCGVSGSSELGDCAGSMGRLGLMGLISLSVAEHDLATNAGAGAGAGAQGGGDEGEARGGHTHGSNGRHPQVR